jgi:hypothetical protein
VTQAWDFVDAHVLWGRRAAEPAFLETPIADIDLGPQFNCRFHNAIVQDNYMRGHHHGLPPLVTVGDLVTQRSRGELLRIPNLGVRSLDALVAYLAQHGVKLRERPSA